MSYKGHELFLWNLDLCHSFYKQKYIIGSKNLMQFVHRFWQFNLKLCHEILIFFLYIKQKIKTENQIDMYIDKHPPTPKSCIVLNVCTDKINALITCVGLW